MRPTIPIDPMMTEGPRPADRLTEWISDLNGRRNSLKWALTAGAGSIPIAVILGALLQARIGGGEPLMATFPVLLVTCLGCGAAAGWISLLGSVASIWYCYLGQQFSFAIQPGDTHTLAATLVVGALIIGVCGLLRSCITSLNATNAASRELASGFAERTVELDQLNSRLNQALADRSQAIEALLLSETQFRTSFEAAAVGKAQSDPTTGRIIRVNRAFANMLGYEADEIVGRLGWDFTHPEDRAAEMQEFQAVLDGHQDTYVREKRYLRRDGECVWGRVSATIVRAPEGGSPRLTVAVIEDIDERHKAKAALLAAKLELEITLTQRTAALAQRDLLLREVYHRVKNNLQVIDGLLVMQRKRLSDPEARDAFSNLRARVFALGLVHQQLMGSQDLETFDIAPFLKELTENILRGAARPNIELIVRAAPLTVGLDLAIPLGLVVTELVTNCLKHAFTERGGKIEVVLERGLDGSVRLNVADDGRGGDGPHSLRPGGPSMGTTIIDGLVQQMGGDLTVLRDHGTRSEIRIAGKESS